MSMTSAVSSTNASSSASSNDVQLISPSDMKVRMRFSVVDKHVLVTMPFEKGEDVEETIKKFCVEEDIPCYLEPSLLCALSTLFEEESRALSEDPQANAIADGILVLRCALSVADLFSRTHRDWNRGDPPSSLSSSSSSSSFDGASSPLQQQLQRTPSSSSLLPLLSSSSSKIISSFTEAFQQLISSYRGVGGGGEMTPEMATLLQLEHSYALALSQLLFEKKIAAKKLHERQEQEMSVACQNAIQNNISALVKKHVKELEDLERKWDHEITELKARQRVSYVEFVLSSHAEKLSSSSSSTTPSSAPSSTSSLPQLQHSHRSASTNQLSEKASSSLLLPQSLHRTSSSTASSLPPSSSVSSTSSSDLELLLFPGDGLQETLTIFLGAQLKRPYNIHLATGDVFDGCRPSSASSSSTSASSLSSPPSSFSSITSTSSRSSTSTSPSSSFSPPTSPHSSSSSLPHLLHPHLPLHLRTLRSLYSEALSAVLFTVPSTLQYDHSKTTRGFLELCNSTTDLHFDDIATQLQAIKDSTSSSSSTSPSFDLQQGDFFVTRHSNLFDTHLAFHLVTSPSASTAKKNSSSSSLPQLSPTDPSSHPLDLSNSSPLIEGLRNILFLCTQYDVSTLTIPVLLLTSEISEESANDPLWLRRAELVLKIVKAFIVSPPSASSSSSSSSSGSSAEGGGSGGGGGGGGGRGLSLKNLRFVLPKSFEAHFTRYSALVRRIFSNAR